MTRVGMDEDQPQPLVLGRYALCDVIGGGGMAKVHIGRVVGAAGFSRVVAIKRLHPAHAADPEFTAMFVDEARLVSRIHHPNVVPTLDVVATDRELLVVMEYVHGLALSELVRSVRARGERLPLPIAMRIVLDVLAGLEAAHEATGEHGRPLRIVHRDISPQNVLVGADGVTRIVDFGIAKAEGTLAIATGAGTIKGKLRYMAPEQLQSRALDLRVDLYATGIVLWELIVGRPLFDRRPEDLTLIMKNAGGEPLSPPSAHVDGISSELDAVVHRALAPLPANRFSSATEMIAALEPLSKMASVREVATYVADFGQDALGRHRQLVAAVEHTPRHQRSPQDVTDDRPVRPEIVFAAGAPTRSVALHQAVPIPGHVTPSAASAASAPLIDRDDTARYVAPLAQPSAPISGVSSAATLRTSRRSLRWPLVVALLVVLALVPMLAAALFRTPRESRPRTPASNAITSYATAPRSEPPPTVSDVAPPAASPQPSHPPSSPPARIRTAPPPDCDPPYRIDERGIRIPRRECLAH